MDFFTIHTDVAQVGGEFYLAIVPTFCLEKKTEAGVSQFSKIKTDIATGDVRIDDVETVCLSELARRMAERCSC